MKIESAHQETVLAVADLPQRGWAICSGVIDSMTIVPASDYPHFIAVLTGQESIRGLAAGKHHRLRIIWLGRRRVPGITAGSKLRVEGMVSLRDGLPTMFNPRYEIIGLQES